MRIAVVSDVHANLTALEAVIADLARVSPDLIVHGGDLVGSGARPAEVVDRIRDLGWPGVQGNSEEMLWNAERVAEYFRAPRFEALRQIVYRAIAATLYAIDGERLTWLRALPSRWSAHDLTVVHASPDDLWRAPLSSASDTELVDTYGPLGSGAVVYGHIHWPYVRRLPSFSLANSGSVGLPYDGDPRSAYAVLDEDGVTIRRVEYDVEREVQALFGRMCPDAAWIAEMLRRGSPLPPNS